MRRAGGRQRGLLWSRAARLGQAAWLFGNLYEGMIGMPQVLADARSVRPAGLLAEGSPVRYFVPVAGIALAPTGITLTQSWRTGADRRLIAATATCLGVALVLSAYLIRTVNVPLLAGHGPLDEPDRGRLVRLWHRGNVVRVVALAVATTLFSRLPPPRRLS